MRHVQTTSLLLVALLAATAPAAAYRQGFNCGGKKTRTMDDGAVYTKDRAYSLGNGSGYVGGEAVRPDLLASLNPLGGIVPGVQERNILSSRRVGWQEYRFDLPNGSYLLSLHFMEWSVHWSDIRVCDIEVEGELLFDDLDIFERADRLYALNLRRIVEVDDGQLNIVAHALIDEPLLSALHVETLVPDDDPPPRPNNVALVPGYSENVLTWTTNHQRDQLGVVVLRSTDGGPEEPITPDPLVATRFVDTNVEAGRHYSYRLVAVDAFGNTSFPSLSAAGVPLASAESDLVVYGFEMSQQDLVWLNNNRQSDTYLPALFWTLDDLWPDARLRYRGNTSRSNVKKNHKIRVDRAFPSGHDVLNLQAHWFDPSMMREALAYQSLALSGVTSGIPDYVHFERNGEYIGVYQSAEQVDEHFLERRGLEGSVWKGIDATFVRRANPSRYYQDYELQVGDYNDFDHLADFIDLVALSSDEEFRTEINKHLDVDRFLDYYAGNAVFSGWDFTGWNLYLYRDRASGLFEFIPWDLDAAWESENIGQPIDIATQDHPILLLFWNRLYDRMTTIPQFRRMVGVRVQQLIEGPVDGPTLIAMMRADHALIRPDVERDKYKLGWEEIDPFDDELAVLERFVERRVENLYEQLQSFAPDPTVNLFVNEALRWNQALVADEWGEFDPWVEIHNFANETIDLGGLWLSDDAANTQKWAFEAGTAIAAGGHLLVWLDGEPGQGALHADFRLAGDAEHLLLSRSGGTPIDGMVFDPVSFPDLPTARVEDAAAALQPPAFATPGASNDPTPVVEATIEADPEYFLGEGIEIEVRLVNHRPFPRDLTLALRAETELGERDLALETVFVDGGDSVAVAVAGSAPAQIEPLEVRLVATLRDELQRVIQVTERTLNLRDPEPPLLVVNEIMASNDTTIADQGDDYDDWVELYNAGGRKAHLAGLFLSDDAAEPRRWPLPDRDLGPGDHLLFWCDDDTEQGWLHGPFKLSKGGEEIGIYDLDLRGNGALDRIVFGPQTSDISEGRSPDGAPSWVVLPFATPGEANP